jgi:putative transcriptional regulator
VILQSGIPGRLLLNPVGKNTVEKNLTGCIVYYILCIVNYTIWKNTVKLTNNLRQFRFEHGEMTQQELANAVGVTRLTIHSIETGKFNPSTVLALKISRFFGVPLEAIFYLSEDEADDE